MKRSFILLLTAAFLSFQSCDLLQQAQKVGNLVNCNFGLKTVENLSLAGVNVQNIQSAGNLNILDLGKLTAAVAGGSLPLGFTLNVEAKNPNASPAGMSKLEWILYIDDIEMTRGMLNQQVNIPGNHGTAMIPIQMNVDLKKVLTNKTGDALLNFGLNLAGAGNKPTRFMLKAKPTISVGGYLLSYPGYITIRSN
ncbi:MAG: hypothetical protein NTU44_16155 [Bacteroidetes bacterium]|nr:hypothetical protein [Bacteroidota bacterium]